MCASSSFEGSSQPRHWRYVRTIRSTPKPAQKSHVKRAGKTAAATRAPAPKAAIHLHNDQERFSSTRPEVETLISGPPGTLGIF
jgi:hypothetical protein